MRLLIMAAAAYLVGCVPAASFALRRAPAGWRAALAAAADVVKGLVAAVWFAAPGPLGIAAALTLVVVGHQYPLIGAKTHRGLGVAAGASMVVTPVAAPLGLVIFGLVYAISGYLELAAFAAAALTPVAVGYLAGWPLAVILAPAALLLVIRSRRSLAAVLTGRARRHLWRGDPSRG